MNEKDDIHSTVYHEENMGLLDERSPSDSDSESGTSDVESRFSLRFRTPKYSQYTSVITIPWNHLRTARWRLLVVRAAIFLTPSFLQGRAAREQICPQKLSPTAYLDGMRGLAALFVFFCHYFYQAFKIAFSWGCDDDNFHFLKLPFLRLWYQGPPAVCVFFIISGYALSYRPLKLARNGALSDFATTMSSMTFRRAIRLYIPTAISTFMIIGLLRLGAYEWTREFSKDRKFMKIIIEPHPERMESAYTQYRDWVLHMYRFIHVFDWNKFGGSTCTDMFIYPL